MLKVMVRFMKATGVMTSLMVRVNKLLKMDPSIMVTSKKEPKTVMGFINGLINHFTKENGKTINLMDLVNILGVMVAST